MAEVHAKLLKRENLLKLFLSGFEGEKAREVAESLGMAAVL